MGNKTLRQSVIFKASPNEVYEALMDSEKHSVFTGAPANIGKNVGDKFSAYDDWIEGINLELVPGQKIVQKWRGKDWAEGIYSTARFMLKEIGKETELEFIQIGVPQEHLKNISEGWKEHYWDKMHKFFDKKS